MAADQDPDVTRLGVEHFLSRDHLLLYAVVDPVVDGYISPIIDRLSDR